MIESDLAIPYQIQGKDHYRLSQEGFAFEIGTESIVSLVSESATAVRAAAG